jgi:hypothetical protein
MMTKSALIFSKLIKEKDLSNEEYDFAKTVLLQYFEDDSLTSQMFQ